MKVSITYSERAVILEWSKRTDSQKKNLQLANCSENMRSNIKSWYEKTCQSEVNRDDNKTWGFKLTNLVNIFTFKIINASKTNFVSNVRLKK